MAPSFSIVVVAYGKRAVSEACLRSLDAAYGDRLGRDVELVLVDNASPDDTAALFAAWAERATVLALPENRNFAGGYNAGAAAATADVVVLLNNDTIVPAGALDVLAEQARDARTGLVGCRLTYPDGTLQHGGFGWRTATGGMAAPFHLFHHEDGALPAARGVHELGFVTGACLATRRSLFTALGGFDEGYVNGWEDVDLCLRVRESGLRVIYRGDVDIVHAEGQTSGGHYAAERNVERFGARWLGRLGDDADRVAALFDATWSRVEDPVHGPPRHPAGSTLVVTGTVGGLGPEAAEARAVLAALEDAGRRPAARDAAPTWLQPRLAADDAAALDRALQRPYAPWAAKIAVGPDRTGVLGTPAVRRLAAPPAGPLDPRTAVLAADARTARAAVAAGADPALVRVAAPVLPPVARGTGGDGVLVLLPAHDLPRAAAVAAALAGQHVPGCTVLPSAASDELTALADRLGAACLAPIAAEDRFAALAGRFDVVVCADDADAFGRRALLAAAAGAAPVLLDETPACEVLGTPPVTVAALADAVAAAADRPDRAERAAAVAAAGQASGLVAATDALLAELGADPRGSADDPAEHVLVVGVAPPTWDRDSGSLRLTRLLEALLAEGTRMTFAGHAVHGLERYVAELEDRGIDVYTGAPDIAAIVRHTRFDAIVLTPYEVAERHVAELRAVAPDLPVIVDTVDLHHLRLRRAAELSGDEQAAAEAEAVRLRELAAYRSADGLLAVSVDERFALEDFVPGVPVGVVSNIHGAEPAGDGFDAREGIVFVAGFGHPPNVDAALWLCREVLPRVRRALPDVPVSIVGSNPTAEIRALAGPGVEVTGWVPETTPYLHRARVSVAPLRYGAGVKGKVGEALAHGLPVVTTSIGAEGMALRDGEDVLVADDADAFAAAVVRAHTDRALWERLRACGRERLLAQFGPDAAVAGWTELLGRVRHGGTFVARPPAGDANALADVLGAYLHAFREGDPVALILGLADPSPAAMAQVGTVVAELGFDPGTIPDVLVAPEASVVVTARSWLVSFDGTRGPRTVASDAADDFRAAVAHCAATVTL